VRHDFNVSFTKKSMEVAVITETKIAHSHTSMSLHGCTKTAHHDVSYDTNHYNFSHDAFTSGVIFKQTLSTDLSDTIQISTIH